MSRTLTQEVIRTEDDRRLFEQERVILDVTEMICELMEQENMSKSDLAQKVGTSKSHITQLLNGTRNMTLRTISDVLYHLGYAFDVDFKEITDFEQEFAQVDFQESWSLKWIEEPRVAWPEYENKLQRKAPYCNAYLNQIRIAS